MFRLSREVRFAVSARPDLIPSPGPQSPLRGDNGYAGVPPVTGMGQCYYRLVVTVQGMPSETGYLLNIKRVDQAVREKAIPLVQQAVQDGCRGNHRGGGGVVLNCFAALSNAFQGLTLSDVTLHLSPYTAIGTDQLLADASGGTAMIRLSHTFEFAASHRLHNPDLSKEENRRVFGKCNNPHGHGHNYQVRVTLVGEADANGFIIDFYELERIVNQAVIEPLDHKHLNIEVDEFRDKSAGGQGLNPSVENIAKVAYQRLKPALPRREVWLEAVTVWETEKTWCEYAESHHA